MTVSGFTDEESALDYARSRWEEGERRIERHTADTRRRELLEDVVEGIMQELEKQIGQTFTSRELAELQDSSEAWCMTIAHERAPDAPWAWDLDTVQNAAFHRYARRASDYQAS